MKALRTLVAVLGLATAVASATAAPLYSVYKDIEQGFDAEAYRIRLPPLQQLPEGPKVVSLAFASGECGAEHWAWRDAQRFAQANLPALAEAGWRYIVSTGGEVGVFTCGSAAGMQRFIERYQGPGLVGFDFDIEGKQTAAQIDDIVRHAAAAQKRWPGLVFSFTLATNAGSDKQRLGLNKTGDLVMKALRRHRFDSAVINLMVMNYGPASPQLCLPRAEGGCDMGRSGLQAARNLRQRYGVPFQRIALTAMIGVNNVAENVFTLTDARTLAREVQAAGLQGVHYWSLDRDTPCAMPTAEPHCSSITTGAALDFARALAQGLAGR